MQSNNIYLFDIRTRKYDKINIEPILDDKVMDLVKSGYSKIGLKVEVSIIDFPEQLAKKYFQYSGYKIIKCSPYGKDFLECCEDSIKDKKIIVQYLEISVSLLSVFSPPTFNSR